MCHTAKPWELDAYLIIWVTRRPLFPGHVLFSRPKKRPGFCLDGYLCFSGSFTNELLRPYKFWKGYLLAELYCCDCVWPRSCIDGLVLVYSSPRVVRFAKQFPARTLGGVTLFVEDDLRDAFFVGVAVVVDCLFTFNQPVDSDSSRSLATMELPKLLEASTWSTLILRHHLMPGVITLTIKVMTLST